MTRKPSFRPHSVALSITAIGARGDGLARHGDDAVFVPLTVPGDQVVARLDSRRGDGLAASLLSITEEGPGRVAPPCALFGRCGGCSLQHLAPPLLAAWKRDRLVTALSRVGLDGGLVTPLIAIPPGSRRRAGFAFTRLRAGVVLGFNQRASPRLIDVDPCLLLAPPLLALLPPLRSLLAACIPVGEGGDAVVTLSDSGLDLLLQSAAPLDLFRREELAAFAERQDLARLSWQSGADPEPVAHRRPVVVMMGDVPVAVPPGGFLQPSAEGEAALVDLVLRAFPERGVLADLYAGSGSFTFPLARAGHSVTAVEGDKAAIAALEAAARHSGLPITAQHRDLARRPLLTAELAPLAGLVFDPPRAGAAQQAEQLARSGPGVVVAVSCNPATLARDAALLVAGGYHLVSATPVDQFAWSAHLEAVAVFRR